MDNYWNFSWDAKCKSFVSLVMVGKVEAVVMAPFGKSHVNGIWGMRKAELVTSMAATIMCSSGSWAGLLLQALWGALYVI